MTPETVLREVPYVPIRHSWYHFSCFHQVLGYALLRDYPDALDYVVSREAVYSLESTAYYPFFRVVHHDTPDPLLSWNFCPDIEPEVLREALTNGAAVVALRDLYDVAGFRHFGQSHHPNWYLLTGFDRRRRTFTAFAERGGLDAELDARCYGTLELTEAEVVFTGLRSKRVFATVMGTFPHYSALTATASLGLDVLDGQEKAVRASIGSRILQENMMVTLINRIEQFAIESDAQALDREHYQLSAWGRKLRSLQILSDRMESYRGCRSSMASSMRCIDDLLASNIFWRAQMRLGRSDRARLVKRQRYMAEGLRHLRREEIVVAKTLGLSPRST